MTQAPNNIDKQRVIKNTLMLYFRQIFIMGVQLYTVRAILNILGVEDYGIFNVVAGFVMLLSFLSLSMHGATQRFFSYALGKNDLKYFQIVFNTNILIYSIITFLAIILLETIGLWFIYYKLNIPPNRFSAALILYQFAIMRFVCVLVSSPFIACLIAHEDMKTYATVSIYDALLNLSIVFILPYCTIDKLKLYGFLLFLSSFCIALTYIILCRKKYTGCSINKNLIDKSLLKEIFDFTSWTLFGSLSGVARTQAITILLNQFFTPVVVAARTISLNVSGAVNTFSSNFNTGLYPSIIKAWSSGNKEEMYQLIFWGSRITFYLTWVFTLPCFLELDFILRLWLKTPPNDAALFTRLVLIESIIFSVSLPLATAARAPGKMRNYELPLGVIQFLILPISWLLLQLGGEAYVTLVVAIFANIIMFFVRLLIVQNFTGLPIRLFTHLVLRPILIVSLISLSISILIKLLLPAKALCSICIILISGIIAVMCIWLWGITSHERKQILSTMRKKFSTPVS